MDTRIRKARKRPVEIEFMVWPGGARNATPVIDWILKHDGTARYHEDDDAHTEHLQIDTLEGVMRADPGDVIIKGVAGEFYPCKPGIFRDTYNVVHDA